jgi:hypothetical protein
MSIEVMCRIADGPLRPGELGITQTIAPLVSWSVTTCDRSGSEPGNDVTVELHLPDSTVWIGEAYVADIEPADEGSGPQSEGEFPVKVELRGCGPLRENTVPLHADVVVARIDAMLVKQQP